jgi:hypothetical protein
VWFFREAKLGFHVDPPLVTPVPKTLLDVDVGESAGTKSSLYLRL